MAQILRSCQNGYALSRSLFDRNLIFILYLSTVFSATPYGFHNLALLKLGPLDFFIVTLAICCPRKIAGRFGSIHFAPRPAGEIPLCMRYVRNLNSFLSSGFEARKSTKSTWIRIIQTAKRLERKKTSKKDERKGLFLGTDSGGGSANRVNQNARI